MTSTVAVPTIAVVDDDPSVQTALGRLLRSVGYTIVTFGSGRAFFEASVREAVECIITDVHMPGWSGLFLQERLSDVGSTVPIVFITGRKDPEIRRRALRAGAIAFLEKPFTEDELFDALSVALADVGS